VDLGVTCNVFLPGHRIRLAVTTSSFPRFDRNPLVPAGQTVLHGGARPSHLVLPVVRS
jgi:predicted acyl esterase